MAWSEEKMKDILLFINAAIEACEEAERDYQFTCPLCGGEAHVSKARCNGHHAARCLGCGMNFIE